MRNRLIALLAGLMVLSIAGAALAAPSVDRMVDLELTLDDAKLTYSVTDPDVDWAADVDVLLPTEDFILNHGQLLKLWKTSLKAELVDWEGGWGCLISAFASSDLTKRGEDGTIATFYATVIDTKCKKKDAEFAPPGKAEKVRTDKGKPDWAQGPKD